MQEAQVSASPSIEAEHFLLALTRDRGVAGRVLGEAGLDHGHERSRLRKTGAINTSVQRTCSSVCLPPRRERSHEPYAEREVTRRA
jgi:Clp amino terminal domain, pathogenicity island component